MKRNRREFVRTMGAGVLAAAGPAWLGAAETAKDKPNIIFILADDLGYGDVGCYGQKLIRTPNLDKMAAEGMRFTDFYAGGAVCIPSRACLMTGLHSGHTRHHGNNAHVPLEDSDITVAEVLRDAGYFTGCLGKWAFGDDFNGPGVPHKQGWDYYYGEPNQTTVHSYYLPVMWEFDRDGSVSGLSPDKEMRKIDIPENAGGKRVVYSHDLLADRALAFVKAAARKSKPFFLYVPFTIPHAELLVPEDSLNEYKGKFPEQPYAGRGDYSANDMPNATYAAMITRMDRDIGRILNLLGDLGIAGKTLVMFSSDNGPVSACGQDLAMFQSAGNLRGLKASLYEGGIRVPTIARWPGAIPPGTVSDHSGAFCDFLPTAAELAGAKTPRHCDGISIAPVLLGRTQEQKKHEFLYWETPNSQAVRMGNWKAIKPARGGKIELYDLSADVSETTDVADKHPDVVAKIETIMRTSHTDFPGSKKPAAKPKRARARAKV